MSSPQAETSWTSDARQEASWCLCIDALDTCGIFVTGQERQAHAFRAKDPLGRQGVGLSDKGRNMAGRAGRWISGKSEVRRGKIWVGVVKERKQILIAQRSRKSAVESKFEVEIELNGRVKRSRTTSGRKGGRAQIPRDRTAPSKETKSPAVGERGEGKGGRGS
jgi:hypothetical protein